MIWIILLCIAVIIIGISYYKISGEGYSAGRGMFKNSDNDISENKNDFSDYEPWEYKNMRK